MYDHLNDFEKALAKFGDHVVIITGLEVGGKITQDDAYKQIKELYKDIKKLYKENKKAGKDDRSSNENL